MNAQEGHKAHMIKKAKSTAMIYHALQRRKYTDELYYKHLEAVSNKVIDWGYGDDAHMICAAWLHDIVEDQDFPIETIKREWGFETAQYVWYLTNYPHVAGNRQKRHEMDVERIAKAPWQAKVIKCADLFDNTSTIVDHDPGFAKVYLREKSDLISEIIGDSDVSNKIIEEVVKVYENAKQKLEEVQNR